MRETTLMEQLSTSVKIKVTKPEPDALRSLYGEPVQIDEDGVEFFVVPAHLSQYTRDVFPKYVISKDFLPDDEIMKLKTKSEEAKKEAATTPPQAKKRGNPNWVKKTGQEEDDESDDAGE